jgi:hypothetical protein
LINNPSNQLEANTALTAQQEAEKVETIMNQRADELKAQLQSQQAP